MENLPAELASTQPRLLKYYEWSLAIGWTLVIAVLLIAILQHERSQAVETARTQARSNFQRDVVYRHWNAEAGAVYVPVNGRIQPNPYLANLPDRDIVTRDGKKLTLVNPSYMTRLVFETAAREYGVKGHMTSLRPIRPENRPDPWEARALSAFSKGSGEESTVEKLGDGYFLRLMKPLKTEAECLKCHAVQGYHVGEIRGGLSVAVPMEPLWQIVRETSILIAVSFVALWGIGLIGIFFGSARLRRAIRERDAGERQILALNRDLLARTDDLETANRELDAFCATVSHDLRSPLSVIGGYCELIREAPAETHLETCADFTRIILKATRRMENLITTLLDFSRISRGELIREPVDLTAVADELALELRAKDPKRPASFAIEPGLTAHADAGLLRVVMQNLLGNAWKYAAQCPETRIEVGAKDRGGKKWFFVRDNGIGFDGKQASGIFDAFQRLDNAGGFEGTGIGLATVKRIIDRHGGEITCEGELGSGATFYFSFEG
ncbi:ATP-binding protein [Geomesophilobacter sediminis]|uniref:histidine kinase n=1 Tax=Geomesophilobacter sediminis TaxID=2798584 RepID=A0A8J7LVL2_9BACT|nr:ATP-binding protein [Geomesophilobacter sediminis]MBJ6725155.1 DUF3365 domain-containing protein [Geomesophilobacter sediminis]